MTFDSSMSYPSSKPRTSALEKLKQSNAAKLELETKKMEERIRSLKEKMTKEKAERERLGGTRWASGKTGPLTKNHQKSFSSKNACSNGNPTKASRKMKVLSDEPIDNYMRKPRPTHINDSASIIHCGQCDENASIWVCHECSENYCDTCFSQFHQKGALRKHTKTRVEVVPIKKPEKERSPSRSPKNTDRNSLIRSHSETERPQQSKFLENGESLLNGCYNEEESAASFAQALQEWRKQGQTSKTAAKNPLTCADSACGTSSQLVNEADNKSELNITFHSSMSYGDRLLLRKGREGQCPGRDQTRVRNKADQSSKVDENLPDRDPNTEEESGSCESADNISPNYREIMQSMARKSSEHSVDWFQDNRPTQPTISIQEIAPVQCNNSSDEKETICIVQESEENSTESFSRPASQHGRLTILEMSSTGDFSAPRPLTDLDVCGDSFESPRYVSSSITSKQFCSKPFHLKPTGRAKMKQDADRAKSAENRPGKKLTTNRHHKNDRKNDQTKKQQNKAPLASASQAWKPKPSHKDMSGFFLAGVEEQAESAIPSRDCADVKPSSFSTDDASQSCFATTWRPELSYPQSSSAVDNTSLWYKLDSGQSHPPDLSGAAGSTKKNPKSPDERTSTEVQTVIADWSATTVRTRVIIKSGEGKHASDEDEAFPSTDNMNDFGTGNQDEDDLATLNELAWELASSTGRLTRCEQDIAYVDGSGDDDSIEDKEGGSGLTSPCTLERPPSFHESIMDDFEEMERKFMDEEY